MRGRGLGFGVVAAAAVTLLGLEGLAETVPTREVVVPIAADAHLENGKPNQNFGTEAILSLQAGGKSRVFLAVDSDQVREALGGLSLLGARLELYAQSSSNNWGPHGQAVGLYPLNATWTEAAVTWNCPEDTDLSNLQPDCPMPWNGGFFQMEPTDTELHTKAFVGWYSFDVQPDIETLLSGGSYYGWVIKKAATHRNGSVDYVSREGAEGLWPRLVLTMPADETPPNLAITSPAESTIFNDFSPKIVVEYSDDFSGVALETLEISLDGASLLDRCTLEETQAMCEPPDLAEGQHEIEVAVEDGSGNRSTSESTFLVLSDEAPPIVTLLQPASGTWFQSSLTIIFRYFDFELAVDDRAIQVVLDGSDITARCDLGTREATCPGIAVPMGVHALLITAPDLAGNVGSIERSFEVIVDTSPPEIALVVPEPLMLNLRAQVLELEYVDDGGEIDLNSLEVFWDEQPLTPRCSVGTFRARCFLPPQYPPGAHRARALVSDKAGNEKQGDWNLYLVLDETAPSLTLDYPQDGLVTNDEPIRVRGTVSDDDLVATVKVNGQDADLTGETYGLDISPELGQNSLMVVAQDRVGIPTSRVVSYIYDPIPPALEVLSPLEAEVVNGESVRTLGKVRDNVEIRSLEINGNPVETVDGFFDVDLPLAPGPQELHYRALDTAGNESEKRLQVERIDVPSVSIDSPRNGTLQLSSVVDVQGRLAGNVTAVRVNGIPAEINGETYIARAVPLESGPTSLVAIAESSPGTKAVSSVKVYRDQSPPRIEIYHPKPGATVSTPEIAIAGLVNDIVPGTVNAAQVTVSVNGVVAEVSNRSFLLSSLALAPGANTVSIVAEDQSGNRTTAVAEVFYEPPKGRRLLKLEGDLQQAEIRSELPRDLEVQLLDSAGQPLSGEPVVFRVKNSAGMLSNGERIYPVESDADGKARARFTLGSRAGVGTAVVEVTARGVIGPQTFLASAVPGPPAFVIVDTGSQQTGAVNQPLPLDFIAVVTDSGYNRLEGVEVAWRVVRGGGLLSEGESEAVLSTDSDGRSATSLSLGPLDGVANNIVTASLPAFPNVPRAAFVASGKAAGLPEKTSVSGLVLDNSGQPVPGATLRLLGTPLLTTTNPEGLFFFNQVPVGAYHLQVDGATTSREGTWPTLEFELTTVPGVENTLGMPIYLLPLETERGLFVSETTGGTLELEELPGFQIEVEPGSVTFPDGSRSGTVSATLVHNDKVPMVPGFGQQPRFIVTIQPAGAIFDPPARMSLPNVEGLPPGAPTEFYSFDHDLGQFVSIGPARVSSNGLLVESDPGVGLLKAGWHCSGNPAASGTPHNCPQCYICDGAGCVAGCEVPSSNTTSEEKGLLEGLAAPADEGCPCDDKDPCTEDDSCGFFYVIPECKGSFRNIAEVKVTANGEESPVEVERNGVEGAPVSFSAEVFPADHSCERIDFFWGFGDGTTATGGQSVSHTYLQDGLYLVKVDARCSGCSKISASAQAAVEVYEVQVKLEKEGDISISEDGKFTEDVVVRVTVVKSSTGGPIFDFGGVVEIEELSGQEIYKQNQGSLPADVEITFSGTATFTASSQVGAIENGHPFPALLESTNYPMFQGGVFSIDQWVDQGILHPRSKGPVPDWLETRMQKIFDDIGDGGDAAAALATVTHYELDRPQEGTLGWVYKEHVEQGAMFLSELPEDLGAMRVPGAANFRQACTSTDSLDLLTIAVLHEARHGYVNLLSTLNLGAVDDDPDSPDNDDDKDFLLEVMVDAMGNASPIIDSESARTVCDQANNRLLRDWKYRGDGVSDERFANEFAMEMDAIFFAQRHESGI